MNKKFTKLLAALALLVMMTLPEKAVGQNVVSGTTYETKDPSTLPAGWSGVQTKTNNTSYFSLTYSEDYIQTASFDQSGFTSITLKARKYGGPDASQGVITVSWYDSDSKTETVLGTISPSGTSLANNTISSPAEVDAGTGYVKIQCKNASSNKGCGVSEVTLNFSTNNPTITVNSTLAVTPVAVSNGELSVTYANITPANGTITLYDSEDNDITSTCDWFTPAFNANFSKVIYSASENTSGTARSLRMHLHVANGSTEADADVAVSQDFMLTTMDQIFARATVNGSTDKDVTIHFNNWVISDINNSNSQYATKAWLTDGTKGCVIYCTSSAYSKFKVKDKLNGKVTCKLKLYTGYAQISSLVSGNDGTTVTPGLTVTNDGTVTPVTDATITGLSAVNTGSVVAFTGLTCQSSSYSYSTGYTLTDGTNTIYVKRNVYSFELTNEATYNVTGVFENTTSGKFIYPRSADDISEVVGPAISVAPQSLSNFTYCEGEGPSAAQTITVSGDNLEGNIALALNNGETSAFEISLSENSGYANTLNLTQANGTVGETTVYVRLKAGLAIANDYADGINLTSTNAITKTVSLAGIVTAPMVTWNLATNSYSSASTTEVNWTSNYVNMTLAKGQSSTNANNYLGGGSSNHTRMYKDQILTFAPVSGYAISNIEIKAYSTSYANAFVNSTWTNATASASSDIVTIEPTNGNNNVSVTFGSACWAYQVTVYYEVSTATPHNIVNDVDMVNGTVLATPSTAVAGATVTLSIYPDAGYYLESDSDIEVDGSSAITLTKVNDGTFTFVMPDEDVTVYAIFSAYTGTYYTLVNSADDLIPGRHYIISSSKDSGAAYAMAAQGSGYREAVSAIVVGNIIYQTENVHEIVLSGDNTNFWTLYDDCSAVSSQGYLYAGTGNKLNNRTDNSGNNNGKWTISFNEGAVNIVSQIEGTDVSNTVKFNNSTSPKRFSCYTPSSGQMSVYLYMKANETNYELYSNTTFDDLTIGALDIYTVHSPALLTINGTLDNFDCEDPTENLIIEDGAQLYTEDVVEATIKKNISAYDPSLVGQGVSNGWYFISYPLNCDYAGDAPTGVTNMIANPATNYDLYKLVDNTWANYKQNADETNIDPGFTLYTGHGYLYANANDVTLEFAGSVNYTDQDNPGISLENGWNLVGNPYTYIVYPSMPYYKMNDAGTAIESTESTGAIAPCTGILVNNEDGTTTDITFSRTAPNAKGGINLALAEAMRGATQMDNAIVSFNEGSKLGKFYFGTQNANLYIPQGTEEYAIVNAEAQGEMPINFRANEDGQYTLTVNPKNVDMNYLHLIDNMTGMDVDLLQTPSYSFNATIRDYESRFRLVFAANNEDGPSTGSGTFAFYSNGNWIINNAGEATLQVIDLTGRILSSETVNGSVSTTINAVPGVYMLRLINGENVNVQKIVVR